MPLDKLVLIVFCVLAGSGAVFWIGALLFATFQIPFAGLALLPAAFAGYVIYRVIAERLRSREDDHYDRMEH
jgi:membrane protein implicated in regulation of membrane protease activity